MILSLYGDGKPEGEVTLSCCRALVELLRQLHGAGGAEAQAAGRILLHGRCREGRQRVALHILRGYVCHLQAQSHLRQG